MQFFEQNFETNYLLGQNFEAIVLVKFYGKFFRPDFVSNVLSNICR